MPKKFLEMKSLKYAENKRKEEKEKEKKEEAKKGLFKGFKGFNRNLSNLCLNIILWSNILASNVFLVILLFFIFFNVEFERLTYSFILPVVLIFGVIDLIVVLTLASGVLRRFGLYSQDDALGLPAGSVRALIALSLIVIFAIMAIFMGTQLSATPLTNRDGSYVTDVNGTVQFYEPSQSQKDFSSQTLTTVSTLVVAVAGFYFGTKATKPGEKKKTKTIKITTNPTDFADVKSNEELTIDVTTEPENEMIDWQVDGDKKSSVTYIGDNQFKYKPSDYAASGERTSDKVILIFQAVKDTKKPAKLRVKIEEKSAKK